MFAYKGILGSRGHAHVIVPLIVVMLIGIVGARLLVDSHAASSTSSGQLQPVASTFLVAFDASTPKSTIENVVSKYRIGGIVILGTQNAADAGFTKSFFNKLNAAAGHRLVIASDEEGVFQRYRYPFDFPSAQTMTGMKDASVKLLGRKVAATLVKNGVNTDLAPVLDVATSNANIDAGTPGRAFSSNAHHVAQKAGAFAAGLRLGGVNPVYKHFPGLGSTAGNSDNEPVTSPSLQALRAKDLIPYQILHSKYGAGVMLDNARVPGLTEKGRVASTSPATVRLLRNSYHFKGLIMTDNLAVRGVPVSLPTAVTQSLRAGVNMPLFTYPGEAGMQAIVRSAQKSHVVVQPSVQKIANFAKPHH